MIIQQLNNKLKPPSNYEPHKAAVMSVTKYHIFEVQDFTEEKEKMWNNLKVNFYFMDLIYFLKYRREYVRGFLTLILKCY